MKTILIFVLTAAAMAAQNIGVFDRQAVVIAYYRSPQFAGTLKTRTAERDAAAKAGDQAKVKALNEWGEKQQDLAHRQLAGEAPVTNILDALRPDWPAIARAAGVQAIISETIYSDANFRPADVTEAILAHFQANAATRKVIENMRGKTAHSH